MNLLNRVLQISPFVCTFFARRAKKVHTINVTYHVAVRPKRARPEPVEGSRCRRKCLLPMSCRGCINEIIHYLWEVSTSGRTWPAPGDSCRRYEPRPCTPPPLRPETSRL